MSSKNIFSPLTSGALDLPVFDRFDNSSAGVLFEGIGSYLDPQNQYVFPILRAESTTASVLLGNEGNVTSNVSGE